MTSLFRWSVLAITALGIGSCWSEQGQAQPNLKKKRIDDQANLFSEKAVGRVTEEIAAIERQSRGHSLLVQTVEHPPIRYKGEKEPKVYASRWAEQNFKELGVNGVYVLICKEPAILRVVVGDDTARTGSFTKGNGDALRDLLEAKLKESKKAIKEEKAENYDAALKAAVDYVRDHMKAALPADVRRQAPNKGPVVAQAQHPNAPAREETAPGWFASGIVGWICLGVVVLGVVWIIMGLIRAFSGGGGGGMARPGMGYGGGGGYGGGYGGGGGGGFFSSMLGGMFGAVAGNWMYNSFFGGGMHSGGGWGGGSTSAGAVDGGDAKYSDPTDTSGTASEGGDWSDGDQGGGDAGGGDAGGDWGGGDAGGGDAGGDTGGGGDWGGGGGDFGGGGGGDFGGGGGDFGGGGGGGDW